MLIQLLSPPAKKETHGVGKTGTILTYKLKLVPANSPLIVWNAETDWESTFKIWNRSVVLKPSEDGETALAVTLQQMPGPDPADNTDHSYAFKYFFGDRIKGRCDELLQKKFLAIKVTDLLTSAQPIQIGLIDKNGSVMAGEITVMPEEKVFRISLDSFVKAPYLVIPRPFPDFLPYKIQSGIKSFDWSSIETLQVIVKPGSQNNVDLYIEKIWLE